MTCAPDGFDSGDGLVTLQVGRAHHARWGIDPCLWVPRLPLWGS